MSERSIVIFVESASRGRYLDLGIDKMSLKIFTCADALGVLDRVKADVVLIDCGIRARRGLKLLKEVKTKHPRVPVVFLTDASSEEMAIAAFRTGARDYFANPVNRSVLKRTILRLLEIQKKTAGERVPISLIADADLESIPDFDDRNVPLSIREVLLYIEENLTDKITLSSLAQQMRMSKFHFSRYFQKYVGMSPMKRVNFARIQRARALLRRDDLTISEIAHRVGYDDLSALLRNFKKITGMTPTEYRKRPGGDHCGLM